MTVRTAAALAGAALTACQAFGLAWNEIEIWAGTGTNRAVFVADWHDGRRPHALAWGYRWNGEATGLDLWRAVTNADPGLSGRLTNTLDGLFLTGLEYRRPRRPGDVLPGTGRHDARPTAYAADHTGAVYRAAGRWSYWTLDGTNRYAEGTAGRRTAGPADRVLSAGSWDIWSYGTNGTAVPPGFVAAAVHYPFAVAVAGYDPGTTVTDPDWISGHPFTNAAAALGRPTVDTTGDRGAVPLGEPAPVVPVYPAFRAFEVVSIGAGGHLTLGFDHAVLDHPDNPYGVDLLVFGNSQQTLLQDQASWSNGDPSNTLVSGECKSEPAAVSVSQDGGTWYAFAAPEADTFMHTLGRVYDPGRAVTNLFTNNAWWGCATDPTLAPDPGVTASNWTGLSVAAVSARYRGAAGGTGYDLGALDLPADPETGLKWIRYVRIERAAGSNPEIDAVADVSPALPYERWRAKHFPWMTDPAREADAADWDGDGTANLVEYGLGRLPANAAWAPALRVETAESAGARRVRARYAAATNAPDADVRVRWAADLAAPVWRRDALRLETEDPAAGVIPTSAELTTNVPSAFFKLGVRHDR